ncbi:hypothetical protein PSN45_000631 [Yamadazyma tenuis]|uniref:Nucleolar complex-associated protein 3 n=1 Tax=Candida tenuis (strain ATCC 10573 / BCRC 21748 / CBS 615 / JCM 9827 / NBRC 10315 / NRRL Y-1498 / VKM Y-70) TaxID=590646 RepID=G3B9N6_CANTC|nr:uncharacterized protein CANTEDRAFT_131395 [Yamadazyma tenuis ATCC 10573]EGV61935.1 hypothetical protein CANTEDRAFT_131395 [Yamadazyma tenuis ATCC 10573]WEJ93170.1 hypothetical protein PSN45_000631 [Yamadazyma tenuis]
MGKRKTKSKTSDDRRKKLKQDADSQLDNGVFSESVHQGPDLDIDQEADWETAEQSYELKPRSAKHKDVVEGLPIKRSDGTVERTQREQTVPESDDEEQELQAPAQPEEKEESEDEFNDSSLSPRERLVKIKEEVAELAARLMEDPEENTACLTRLRKMSKSKNFVVSQLAIISLVPVFKSLAPGYKIRQLTDAEKREKVSKEVARLRQFEQSLIYNYKLFVDHLGDLGRITRSNSMNNKNITENQVKLGQLALKVCCEMASSALKFFNNRNELLTIIVKRLNKKPQDIEDHRVFTKCIRLLESLLAEDKEHGELSHDLTNILCKTITEKKYRVDESVLNIFLSLSVLDDYNPSEGGRRSAPKLKKKDRVHLSKKQRKSRKEMKEIEEELEKAKQTITAEEREKFQAKILQRLLKLYLEILKVGASSVDEKNDAGLLMAAVLEGLSKFGKMANFDLLGDFLEVLREIMTDIVSSNSLTNEDDADEIYEEGECGLFDSRQIRTILLCIMTSFQLTLNHLTVGKLPISIDLSRFVSTMYLILSDLALDCELEFSSKSLRLLDPLSNSENLEKPSVNVSTKSELLLNCLDSIFFRSRNGSVSRSVSFTKRLYLSILHTPEKTSLATLKFIGKLVNKYGESLKGLWNTEERISGEGSYQLGIEIQREVELERCNSSAATLWENVLLDKHYSPMVRDGARSLMKLSKVNDRKV